MSYAEIPYASEQGIFCDLGRAHQGRQIEAAAKHIAQPGRAFAAAVTGCAAERKLWMMSNRRSARRIASVLIVLTEGCQHASVNLSSQG